MICFSVSRILCLEIWNNSMKEKKNCMVPEKRVFQGEGSVCVFLQWNHREIFPVSSRGTLESNRKKKTKIYYDNLFSN